MLGLNETVDQLAMANSVHWCGHVLRREDGHVLRRALDLEVVGQRMKGRRKRTWKGRLRKKVWRLVCEWKKHFADQSECQHEQDCCWIEVNLAALSYCGYYQIVNIGVCLYVCLYI